MTSLQDKIKLVGDALAEVTPNCYHYFRMEKQYPCIIWQEEAETTSLETDDEKSEQIISGSVDYFTRQEYDKAVDSIQETLNKLSETSWRLSSILYEEQTNLIHYSWDFEV